MANASLDDLRLLNKEAFNRAKSLWASVLFSKFGAAVLGIMAVAQHQSSSMVTGAVVCLAGMSEVFQLRSDWLRSSAESMLRKLEVADGFGSGVPAIQVADHLATLSTRRRKALQQEVEENYFASNQEPGPTRILQNVRESAWWSKQLALTMAKVSGIVGLITFFGCLVALYIAMSYKTTQTDAEVINKVVAGVLSLVVSLGLIKLTYGYLRGAMKAGEAENLAQRQLASGAPTELDASKIVHEYQIVRLGMPLLPNLLWKLRRRDLNELWSKYGE